MANKKDATREETKGNLGLLALSVAGLFYRILLLTLVWDWFIADKLFEISYWGMFLATIIIELFNGGFATLHQNELKFKKIFEGDQQLSMSEKYQVKLQGLFASTLFFGVIWLVYVIIT